MAGSLILLDSSVLIAYFRKKDKSGSLFYQLAKQHKHLAISVITEYEILVGSNEGQVAFWKSVFANLKILPLNSKCMLVALNINQELKAKRNQVSLPDLFIAATAISNHIKIATLDTRHFSRISNLEILETVQ